MIEKCRLVVEHGDLIITKQKAFIYTVISNHQDDKEEEIQLDIAQEWLDNGFAMIHQRKV